MTKVVLLNSPHPFAANSYLISSDNEYAIVDPTTPFDESFGDKIKYVLLTHAHFDHILDIDSWVSAGAEKVIISSEGVDALPNPMRNCYKLYNGSDNGYFGIATKIEDGEELLLGSTKIKFLYTPGHTSCSGIYIIDNCVFVGDTVFAGGGYGRFDLPTGNYIMLRDSINKILDLPDDMILYPGHGETTTVKEYKDDFFR